MEKEVTRVAKASVAVQAVLEAEIWEHNMLQSAARTTYEALEVGGVESSSSLGSRLIALSGRVHERLRGALHMGVKRALAVVSSHYAGVDLEAVSDGYIMAEDDENAEEEVLKLVEAAEALAQRWPGCSKRRWFLLCRPPTLATLSFDLGQRGHVNRLGLISLYHNACGHRGLYSTCVYMFFNRFLLYF